MTLALALALVDELNRPPIFSFVWCWLFSQFIDEIGNCYWSFVLWTYYLVSRLDCNMFDQLADTINRLGSIDPLDKMFIVHKQFCQFRPSNDSFALTWYYRLNVWIILDKRKTSKLIILKIKSTIQSRCQSIALITSNWIWTKSSYK